MKLEEGPAFGALVIGVGIGWLVHAKTGNYLYAGAAGLGLATADYFLLIWINSLKKR